MVFCWVCGCFGFGFVICFLVDRFVFGLICNASCCFSVMLVFCLCCFLLVIFAFGYFLLVWTVAA